MWIELLGSLLNFESLFPWIFSFPLSSKAYSSLWLSLWAWKNYSIQTQKQSCKIFEMILLSLLSVNLQHIQHANRPIFTVVSLVAWPLNENEAGDDLVLIETSLLLLLIAAINWHKNSIINIRRTGRFLSKQGHLLPHFHSTDRQL